MNISKKSNLRPTIENRQARFNYELLDDFEAGISLEGWEVKSIRNGQIELKNAYVVLKKGEAWIIGLKILPMREINYEVSSERSRKLLLTKAELSKLFKQTNEKGLSCIPIKIFWKNNLVKVKISVARGKSKYDKRHSLKNKEWRKEKSSLENFSN